MDISDEDLLGAELATIARSLDGEPPDTKHPYALSRGQCLMILKGLALLKAVRAAANS